MKTKLSAFIGIVMLIATSGMTCRNWDQGQVRLISEELRDAGREGTIYALTVQPDLRPKIEQVQVRLAAQSLQTNITFNSFMLTVQQLPVKELKSPEARLIITGTGMILRRVGYNVDLGSITNINPLISGLSLGLREGLDYQIVP